MDKNFVITGIDSREKLDEAGPKEIFLAIYESGSFLW